jgi:Na+/melibiose symporter-like transporter
MDIPAQQVITKDNVPVIISGVVTDATRSARVKGRAHVAVRFDTITPRGTDDRYRIRTAAIGRTAAATKRKDAFEIGAPAVGGAIIGLVTAPFAVIADAVSFLASAVLIFLVRKRETAPERQVDAETGRGPGMRTEIAEGLRYVLGNRYLRSIAASTGSSNLFSNMMFSIFLVYVFRNLGLSPLTIGIVGGLSNLGFMAGAVIAGRVAKRLGVGRAIVLSSLVAGGMELLIPLAPESAAAIPLVFISQLVVGVMVVVYNVNQVSLRQAITPERMQGRMNATMRFIVWGTIPIGIIIGGILGSTIGLHATLWVGAIGGCFAFLPLLFSPVRSLVEIPTEPAQA